MEAIIHNHVCYDCGRIIKARCGSMDCILEPVENVVSEQCCKCARRPVRYADENPRWES